MKLVVLPLLAGFVATLMISLGLASHDWFYSAGDAAMYPNLGGFLTRSYGLFGWIGAGKTKFTEAADNVCDRYYMYKATYAVSENPSEGLLKTLETRCTSYNRLAITSSVVIGTLAVSLAVTLASFCLLSVTKIYGFQYYILTGLVLAPFFHLLGIVGFSISLRVLIGKIAKTSEYPLPKVSSMLVLQILAVCVEFAAAGLFAYFMKDLQRGTEISVLEFVRQQSSLLYKTLREKHSNEETPLIAEEVFVIDDDNKT